MPNIMTVWDGTQFVELDARNSDMLDGYHASSFIKNYLGNVTDFNVALTEGEYSINGTVPNAPSGVQNGKLRVYVNDGGTHNNANNWIWQYVDEITGLKFYRNKANSGTWSTWQKIVTVDMIPTTLPANGGNSDTIDGKHAAQTPYTTEKNDIIGMINELKNRIDNLPRFIIQTTDPGSNALVNDVWLDTTNYVFKLKLSDNSWRIIGAAYN